MGHTNSVHYCLRLGYWEHAMLRKKKMIDQKITLNVPSMEGFNPVEDCVIYELGTTVLRQHMDDRATSCNGTAVQAASQCRNICAFTSGTLGWSLHEKKLLMPIRPSAKEPRYFGGFELRGSKVRDVNPAAAAAASR